MAMVGMAEGEPLHTSLAGVERGATALWIDGTAKDFSALREFVALKALRIYRLPRRHLPMLARCHLPRLTTVGVRHVDDEDFGFLSGFVTLDALTCWTSLKVMLMDGIERLTRPTSLGLTELGAIESLAPLAGLTELRSLGLSGGVSTTQMLPSLAPLRMLTGLEKINLMA